MKTIFFPAKLIFWKLFILKLLFYQDFEILLKILLFFIFFIFPDLMA